MSVIIRLKSPAWDQFVVRILANRNVHAYLMGGKMLPALVGTGEGGKT